MNFNKKIKGFVDWSLFLIIFFIGGFLLLMEIGNTITTRVKLLEKSMELNILYKARFNFIVSKYNHIIMKNLSYNIEQNQKILSEQELLDIFYNYIPSKYKVSCHIQYNHKENQPQFSKLDGPDMKKLLLYDWLENSCILIKIVHDNKKYNYKISLKNLSDYNL